MIPKVERRFLNGLYSPPQSDYKTLILRFSCNSACFLKVWKIVKLQTFVWVDKTKCLEKASTKLILYLYPLVEEIEGSPHKSVWTNFNGLMYVILDEKKKFMKLTKTTSRANNWDMLFLNGRLHLYSTYVTILAEGWPKCLCQSSNVFGGLA